MQTTPKRRWLFLVGRIPARRTPTGRVLDLVPSSAPAAAPKEAA